MLDLASQLRRDEGLRLKPYKDSVGKLTIGYGRNLDDVGIFSVEADTLLANDIRNATVILESNFPWTTTLDQVRKDVLLNMTFNIGIGDVAGFKDMLASVKAGNFSAAARAMLDSKWAEQVGPRAQRLSIQMESGVRQ